MREGMPNPMSQPPDAEKSEDSAQEAFRSASRKLKGNERPRSQSGTAFEAFRASREALGSAPAEAPDASPETSAKEAFERAENEAFKARYAELVKKGIETGDMSEAEAALKERNENLKKKE
ncbi:MAG: hypothetical protein RLZZ324_754 [Candidatus Parcubacteria bacterium]|jgi:hypothetical protein